MKKIFVIIVTYNAMRWIDRCLQCLRESTVPVVPVVVDNGSTDGTREHIPSHFPEVVWLPQGENLGFGQGNNVGIRYALQEQADYVMLLNQDAYLDREAISHLLAADDGHSMLSPLHLSGDGQRLDNSIRTALYRAVSSSLFDDILIRHSLNTKYQVADVCAACWFLPMAIIRQIGGFNPIFFHYGEDNNFAHRLAYHHVPLYVIPSASMRHDRVEHGNLQVYNRNRLRREMLLVCCNINLGLKGIFVQLLRLLALSYAVDLPQRQYRIGAFLVNLFWLLAHLGQVSQSRRTDRQVSANWL